MKRFFVITLIVILLAIYSCSKKDTVGEVTVEEENGVVVVKNPKEPLYKDTSFSLKEDLVIGEAQGQDEYMFSHLRSIAVDEEGNIYAADDSEMALKVFDENGKFLRSILREGQGPGEIGSPYDILITENKELFVYDGRNMKIHFFTLGGEHLRSKDLKAVFPLEVYSDSKQNYYILNSVRISTGTSYNIVRLDEDMNVVSTLIEYPTPPPPDTFQAFISFLYCKVLPDDNLLYGDSKDYELQVLSPEGQVLKRIIKEYNPSPVTEKDKEFFRRNMPKDQKVEFPSHHQAFYGFFLDDTGRIYVKTWQEPTDRVQYLCDVFDKEGRYIARIPLSISPQVWKKGKVYTIEEDEEGFHQIKRYQVIWDLLD
jgi:hypothetical protein